VQLVRRCAVTGTQCELIEQAAGCGESVDLESYGMMTDRLGRAFDRIGVKRRPRDLAPALAFAIAGQALRGTGNSKCWDLQ
jgi:hypothetical protein